MKSFYAKIRTAILIAAAAMLCFILCSCSAAEVNLARDGSGTATVRIAKTYIDDGVTVSVTEKDVKDRIDGLIKAVEYSSGMENRLKLRSIKDAGEFYSVNLSFMRAQYICTYGGDAGYYSYKKSSEFVKEADSVATLTEYWYYGSYKPYLKSYENAKYNFANYRRPSANAALKPKRAGAELTEAEVAGLFSESGELAENARGRIFTFYIADMEWLESITFNFKGKVEVYAGTGTVTAGERSLTVTPVTEKADITGIDADGEVIHETRDVKCFVGYVYFTLEANKAAVGIFAVLGVALAGFVIYGIITGVFKRFFKGKFFRSLVRNYDLYLMVIPGVVLLFLFAYLPMGGVTLAFKNYRTTDGIWRSEWTSMFGLKNFYDLFAERNSFPLLIKNTFVLAFWKFIFGFLIAIALAVLFSYLKNGLFKKTVQTISYFPYFISWVVISTISYMFLATDGGILNKAITAFGGTAINWYASPKYWPFILTFTAMWRTAGYSTIIYLAAIVNINPSLYEAATIDGAGRFQQLLHITLPGLIPVLGIQIVFSLGNLVRDDFDQIYTMVRGSALLRDTTDTIGKIVYENIGTPSAYSSTAAMGLLQGLVGLILVVTSNAILKRHDIQGAY
ncbi:MAG: sugar ABC transporter permease [Clostridia bacterium]|nr:sugar ABC transporter permease [Clostridia bacterium]